MLPLSRCPCNTYISEMFYKVKMHETCALRVRTVNLLSFPLLFLCCCCCCCCLFVFHKRAFCILQCSVCARCRLPHSTKVFAKMFSLQLPQVEVELVSVSISIFICVSFCVSFCVCVAVAATTANGDTFQAFATLFASHNCLPSGSSSSSSSVSSISQRTRCAAAAALLLRCCCCHISPSRAAWC